MQETQFDSWARKFPWKRDRLPTPVFLGFPGGSDRKNSPAMWETLVQPLVWEDPLEEGRATHSSVLAWRIPWKRSLGGYNPWGHTESDSTEAT